MNIIRYPNPDEWDALLKRPTLNSEDLNETVREILNRVRTEGDKAVRDCEEQFDKVRLDNLQVTPEEFDEAEKLTSIELKAAILLALNNIKTFHSAQRFETKKVTTLPGVTCWQKAVAIEKVGLYIPGGMAPLFSTVLMLATPAQIAGCKEIILCTPPDREGKIHPAILYAAKVAGVTRVFKIGGVQAIGAMAYGTTTVPKVYKIFGPGNRFVTKAKQIVSQTTAIDMPAGPSEVLVMADSSAVPAFVAADMLSQAEHGRDSQAMLVCSSVEIAERVKTEIARQMQLLHRPDALEHSLSHSRLLVFNDTKTMIDFANAYAAEHLIISMERPWEVAQKITAAGSVFIGNYSPESAGDYASGTNHTLPTSGWARSFSGVNLDSFQRKITYQELTAEGLKGLSETIISMADAEGLDAHAAAVKVRTGMI